MELENARESWKDVASKVEGLGLKLKMHLEQEQNDEVEERAEGDTRDALEELGGKMTDAFDAFGNAAKDDAVHSDVKEIAELLKQALIETLRAVGAEVGELMEQIEDYAEDAAEKISNMGSDGDGAPDAVTDTVTDTVIDTVESTE